MTDDAHRRVVIATGNEGKRAELESILTPVLPGVDVVTASSLGLSTPVEDGTTFEANALIKARAAAAQSGLPAFADDSGLTVEILGGAPGIFSARWSGGHGDDAANTRLLLAQLADIAPEHRRAAFVCAAAFATPDGYERTARGLLHGTLTSEPRGSGGFGYDPIFVPDTMTETLAELTAAEKNAISHRAKAFSQLVQEVAAAL